MKSLIRLGLVNALFLLSATLTAQIKGKVTDSLNNPMQGVSVYIKDSFVGKIKLLRVDYFWALGKLKHNQGIRINLAF
ncbi:hypothetical protein N9X09_00675 [Flavobacteriaceae bacterium]|nr:hypothetical protein [Flavobacteriaceae bacterium]